jgi:hypothetical protein
MKSAELAYSILMYINPNYLHNYGPEVWTACHITLCTFHSSSYKSVTLPS